MKSEIKIEFENSKRLLQFFTDSYDGGKIKNSQNRLEIEPDDAIYHSIKTINNGVLRLTNKDVIDGFCRFIISSTDEKIELIPISINYILIDRRWIFF